MIKIKPARRRYTAVECRVFWKSSNSTSLLLELDCPRPTI